MRRLIDNGNRPITPKPHIGHYGRLRKAYLEQYRHRLYTALPNHTFGAESRISGNVDFCRIIKATSRFFQILRFCTIHAFLHKSTPLTG